MYLPAENTAVVVSRHDEYLEDEIKFVDMFWVFVFE